MRGQGWIGGVRWVLVVAFILFSAASAWGIYFDKRREMSLSGFAYTRGTWALSNDEIGNFKGLWQRGNLVQHRNFGSLILAVEYHYI